MSNDDVDDICVDFSEEELNEIIEEADKIISDYNGDSEVLANAYFKEGTAYAKLKKHKEAIDDFSNAIQYGPDEFKKFPYIFHSRGQEYTEMGDYKNAIDDFSETLRLNPDQAAILLFRGKAYHLAGEQEKAKADFDEYINRKHKIVDDAIYGEILNIFGVKLKDIPKKDESILSCVISEIVQLDVAEIEGKCLAGIEPD
jgi:tetratricopeptide (TPR) repeat protein